MSYIKELILDFCPPFFLKIKKKFRPISWENIKYSKNGVLFLPGGIYFNFRPYESSDFKVCKQIFFNKDYELNKLSRYEELINYYNKCSNPIIVDAGANIGAASVWFALRFPLAKIIAIEPDKENFRLLSKNSNSFSSIVPYCGAISSRPGELYLKDPKDGAWGYLTSDTSDESSIPVKAITIEDIFSEKISGNPFIFKIDIEGAEEDLFSRSSKIFDEFPLIIIELHDWLFPKKGKSQNFLKWHLSKNRDFVYIGENIFSISNRF